MSKYLILGLAANSALQLVDASKNFISLGRTDETNDCTSYRLVAHEVKR